MCFSLVRLPNHFVCQLRNLNSLSQTTTSTQSVKVEMCDTMRPHWRNAHLMITTWGWSLLVCATEDCGASLLSSSDWSTRVSGFRVNIASARWDSCVIWPTARYCLNRSSLYCLQALKLKCLSCVWSEASLCNVSRAVWNLLAPHWKPSHWLTSSQPSDPVTGMGSFAGSAIAQGINQLEDLVRGFQSTKWLLLAGASDPPCKTSTRRARDCDRSVDWVFSFLFLWVYCDRGSSFLQGVTNDLALMEKSPVVKNCLHNTVRKGPLKILYKFKMLAPYPSLCQAHFWQLCLRNL